MKCVPIVVWLAVAVALLGGAATDGAFAQASDSGARVIRAKPLVYPKPVEQETRTIEARDPVAADQPVSPARVDERRTDPEPIGYGPPPQEIRRTAAVYAAAPAPQETYIAPAPRQVYVASAPVATTTVIERTPVVYYRESPTVVFSGTTLYSGESYFRHGTYSYCPPSPYYGRVIYRSRPYLRGYGYYGGGICSSRYVGRSHYSRGGCGGVSVSLSFRF